MNIIFYFPKEPDGFIKLWEQNGSSIDLLFTKCAVYRQERSVMNVTYCTTESTAELGQTSAAQWVTVVLPTGGSVQCAFSMNCWERKPIFRGSCAPAEINHDSVLDYILLCEVRRSRLSLSAGRFEAEYCWCVIKEFMFPQQQRWFSFQPDSVVLKPKRNVFFI